MKDATKLARTGKHASRAKAARTYAAMQQASLAVCLPQTMQTDLTMHDRAYVSANPDATFIWFLYEHGTHIVRVSNDKDKPSREAAQMVRKVTGCLAGKLYIVDPNARWPLAIVRPASVDDAADFARGGCSICGETQHPGIRCE